MAADPLAVGARVHIDTDTEDWGRVASDATVLEAPEDDHVYLSVDSIRAFLVVPVRDVATVP